MSIYFPADESQVSELLAKALERHQDLAKAKVRFGITMVISSKEGQPALKEFGQPVFGTVKIISPIDRARKAIDVEMFLDSASWCDDTLSYRLAKLDNLLTRIEARKPKPKKKKKKTSQGTDEENQQHEEAEFLEDSEGRTLLRKRKPDLYVSGGFRDVLERNGKYSPEYIAVDVARTVIDTIVTNQPPCPTPTQQPTPASV